MHGGGSVARAGEAVAEPEIAVLRPAVEAGEGLDLLHRQAGDGGGPFGRARGEMALQLGRHVAVAGEIVAVGVAVAEEDVHDATGKRAVGAGAEGQVHVGLLGRGRAVGVDHDQLRTALLPGAGDVAHQVHVRADRVAAPDHDEVGMVGDLGRRHAPALAMAGLEAGIGEQHADRALEARVALRVGQALDAVALHEAHGAGVPVGPDGLGPVPPLGVEEGFGDTVERLLPADPLELARALGAGPAHRVGQALGMVEPLVVAGDLGADHARRVGHALAPAHLAQTAVRQLLDLERADRRAVVRAYGRVELAHRPCFRAGDAAVMMMWWHRLRRNLRGLARFRAQ